MKRLSIKDLAYLAMTALWSVAICQAMRLSVGAFFAGSDYGSVMNASFNVATVTSVMTGCLRRRPLAEGEADNVGSAFTSFGLNFLLWSIGMGVAAVVPGSGILTGGAPTPSIFAAPVHTAWFMLWGAVGVVLLSPIIGTGIVLSQLFMSFAAKATWRPSHA